MLKKALPHILSIAAFYAIACIFYLPVIQDGKRLVQGDTKQYIGMSHETLSYADIEGERPAWTDSMFGGMPTVQITGPGIMTLPKYIWYILRLLMSPEIMTLFLAMLSAYVLALCLKAPPLVAFITGVAFGLASINILYMAAGHATKVRAIALMPGVLGGVIYAFRNNMWGGAAITAFFLSMHIDANHLQMTYYLMFLIGAVGICELIASQLNGSIKKFATTSVILLAAAFVSLLPSLPGLQITKDYSSYTTRGEAVLEDVLADQNDGLDKDYILEYSLSRGEWLSGIVPDIKGGASQLYWGEQRFSGGAIYFGAIAFALLLAFFFVGKDRLRWPVLAITILAIILSWRDASFVTDFFLDYIPMFSKFRDTKMMLVLVQLSVALGVAMMLKRLWDESGNGNWKPWIYSLGGVTGVLILFYILPTTFFDFTSSIRPDRLQGEIAANQLTQMRLEVFRADVLRSIGLIILATGAVFVCLKGILKREVAIGILAVLLLFDVYNVDQRYNRNFDSEFNVAFPHEASVHEQIILQTELAQTVGFEEKYKEHVGLIEEEFGIKMNSRTATGKYKKANDAAMFRALNRLSHFRVLYWQNPMNDARTSYFFKSVGGYHGAKLRRYQDFITYVLQPQNERFLNAVKTTNNLAGAAPILKGASMLNTKYISFLVQDGPIPLPNALGPAWVVNNINWVESNDDELFSIENTDVATTAIVHEEFRDYIPQFTQADSAQTSVELLAYHPEGSTYKVSGNSDGLLVLSEIWYPEGWSATIDGEEAQLLRANYILRALPITAGDHEVVLKYEPAGAKSAGIVSGIGSLLLFLFIAVSWYMCCGVTGSCAKE